MGASSSSSLSESNVTTQIVSRALQNSCRAVPVSQVKRNCDLVLAHTSGCGSTGATCSADPDAMGLTCDLDAAIDDAAAQLQTMPSADRELLALPNSTSFQDYKAFLMTKAKDGCDRVRDTTFSCDALKPLGVKSIADVEYSALCAAAGVLALEPQTSSSKAKYPAWKIFLITFGIVTAIALIIGLSVRFGPKDAAKK